MKTTLHSPFATRHSPLVPLSIAFLAVLWLFTASPRAPAQAFSNLDFEAAVVETNGQPGPSFWLEWDLAAPGWSHSDGDGTASVYYFAEHLGMSQYFLLMDSVSPYYAPGTQLAGNYSLALASGRLLDLDPGSPWVQARISQTGTIPADAQAIRLLATGPFRVFVGDAEIGMTALGGNAYQGDISAFAGTLAELKIMNTSTTVHTPTVVDDITFIPEPSSAALSASGMAALFLRRRTILRALPPMTRVRSGIPPGCP